MKKEKSQGNQTIKLRRGICHMCGNHAILYGGSYCYDCAKALNDYAHGLLKGGEKNAN